MSDGGTGICLEELWIGWTASVHEVEPATVIEYEVRIDGVINEVVTSGTSTITYTDVLGANTVDHRGDRPCRERLT